MVLEESFKLQDTLPVLYCDITCESMIGARLGRGFGMKRMCVAANVSRRLVGGEQFAHLLVQGGTRHSCGEWSPPVFPASFLLKRISGARSGLDFDVVLGGLSIFFASSCFSLDTSFGGAAAVVVHVVRLGFSSDAVWLSHLVQRETLTKLCSIQLDGRSQQLPPPQRTTWDFRCRIRWEAFSHLHCVFPGASELDRGVQNSSCSEFETNMAEGVSRNFSKQLTYW